jgi:hypothetical protein
MKMKKAECLGRSKIEDELELGRLLDREVGRLRPAQNLVDKVGIACLLERGPAQSRQQHRGQSEGWATPQGEPLTVHIKNETPKKALGDRTQEWRVHCQIPQTETKAKSAKCRGAAPFYTAFAY